jgi:hypothetical protein
MTRDQLRPGDCLLYAPNSFWSYAIAVKTWNKISHCEAFIGHGESVNKYALRLKGLSFVLRPPATFNLDEAMAWFADVKGQKYDWIGLSRFILWGATPTTGRNNKMFCSEFLTRWYRAGGYEPFNARCDADSVAPATFLYSPMECHAFEG